MREKNLDFDTVRERRNTGCLKYDLVKKNGMREDILPMWVADMDFEISSCVQDALRSQVEHGIFGYSDAGEGYFDALRGWMERRHHWKIQEEWLVRTPGVVFALANAVRAFTAPGESVLIQPPVYHPFRGVIEDNGRRTVKNPLICGPDDRYHIDFEDFEKKIKEEKVRMFLLCNPHNPVGRVWTKEELSRMGEICREHGVIVVSDEIHQDFVFKGEHQVFSNLNEEYGSFTITCTAPSKTFNLAGLQASNILIPNPELRSAFCRQMNAAGYDQLNVMGLVACEAAYRHGDEWYVAMRSYIRENIQFAREYVEENLPDVRMAEHEGTYLIWLDFRKLGLSEKELEELMIHKAGLWLDGGEMFGEGGSGFQRVNVACPRSILKEALERLRKALQ